MIFGVPQCALPQTTKKAAAIARCSSPRLVVRQVSFSTFRNWRNAGDFSLCWADIQPLKSLKVAAADESAGLAFLF